MEPAAISASPAVTTRAGESMAPVSPAASAKGTVKPSASPMTLSLTTRPAVKWCSTCGVVGMGPPRYALTPGGRAALARERKVVAISPLAPRPVVADEPRIAEQAQDKIGVGGAMMGLAVGDDRLVGRHGLRGVHGAKLVHGLEGAVSPEILLPLHVDRAGIMTAPLGAHILPPFPARQPPVRP